MTKSNIMQYQTKEKLLQNILCLTILICLSIGKLFGQKIITDRPDQTESSSTVKKGDLQIESGILIKFIEENSEIQRQLFAPSTLFRIGVIKGMELRVLTQVENIKFPNGENEFNGVSDLEVGTKIQLLQKENINSEIAILSHLIIPTGTKSHKNEKLGTINKLSISHELNDQVGFGYNLGYNYFGIGKGDLTYSIALGFGISERVSIYIEPYGDLIEFKDYESNIDAGLTYLVRDNFQLDFSFGTGMNYNMNYNMNYISFGFSWSVEK